MRMPTKARSAVSRFATLALGTVLLGACAGDLTSPNGLASSDASLARGTHFNPGIGNKEVLAVGQTRTYSFTIDPRVANRLDMGIQTLEMPANTVCALTSSYGPGTWDAPCTPATTPLTITAIVTGTATYPRVDFYPAMRFNPAAADVELFMFAKHASLADAQRFKILYCSTLQQDFCEDESVSDSSLLTRYSAHDNEVYRKIKHFSGYVVAEFTDGDGSVPSGF